MKALAWLTGAVLALLAAELISFGDIGRFVTLLAALLAALCALAAAFGCVYTLVAAALTHRFFARAPREPHACPPVTIQTKKQKHPEQRKTARGSHPPGQSQKSK